MTDNVTVLPVMTTLDLPAERVLQGAVDAGMTEVVVLGYDAKGDEYFAHSHADAGRVLWLMERFKHRLMEDAD